MTTDHAATGTQAAELRILADVKQMLTELLGDEYALDLDIGMSTSFDRDLELESIEVVALAEKLGERYGESVDFLGFFADLEVEELIELTVGDVVSHVMDRVGDG